jgi:hypothetical protein
MFSMSIAFLKHYTGMCMLDPDLLSYSDSPQSDHSAPKFPYAAVTAFQRVFTHTTSKNHRNCTAHPTTPQTPKAQFPPSAILCQPQSTSMYASGRKPFTPICLHRIHHLHTRIPHSPHPTTNMHRVSVDVHLFMFRARLGRCSIVLVYAPSAQPRSVRVANRCPGCGGLRCMRGSQRGLR